MLRVGELRNSIQIRDTCQISNSMPDEGNVFGINFALFAFLFELVEVLIYDASDNFSPRPVSETFFSDKLLSKPLIRCSVDIFLFGTFFRVEYCNDSIWVFLSDSDVRLIDPPDLSYLRATSLSHVFEVNDIVLKNWEFKLRIFRLIVLIRHQAIIIN